MINKLQVKKEKLLRETKRLRVGSAAVTGRGLKGQRLGQDRNESRINK